MNQNIKSMDKNYLIIASKKDLAGMNIVEQLKQFGKFNIYIANEEIIFTENLDLSLINKYNFIIFASKHKSEEKRKTLSVHAVGNWREAKLGGEPGKICPTSAFFIKEIFKQLKKNAEAFKLDYNITLECTHHGPLITKPCIFIEIGSTESEWKNKRAGFVVAKTISELIENFKEGEEAVTIGIGGPHYCPNFNKIQMSSEYAISHIIPGYALPLKEEMIDEAINKTYEKVEMAILDWKGIKNADERQRVIEILKKKGLYYKKTDEIKY